MVKPSTVQREGSLRGLADSPPRVLLLWVIAGLKPQLDASPDRIAGLGVGRRESRVDDGLGLGRAEDGRRDDVGVLSLGAG